MKIGIVSFWFNRGQATVGRGIRDICLSLGHEVCVLSRPSCGEVLTESQKKLRTGNLEPYVIEASKYNIPVEEYLEWINKEQPKVVFCFQNYQFDEIAAVRDTGVETVGCFMWEDFEPSHVEGAKRAYSHVYALTRSSVRHFGQMGLECSYVRWGCQPADVEHSKMRATINPHRFFYPGGFISVRKCLSAVLEAWKQADTKDAELIVKVQRPLHSQDMIPLESKENFLRIFKPSAPINPEPARDREIEKNYPGVKVVTGDIDADEYFKLFSSCGVCLCPTRWEGLGLHLFEATALGMPIIANDIEPVNEIALNGKNALLCSSRQMGERMSGIGIMEPDIGSLARAIEAALESEIFDSLCRGALRRREQLCWKNTVADFDTLIKGLGF